MEVKYLIDGMPVLNTYSEQIPNDLLSSIEVLYINHIISDSLMVARALRNAGANLTIIPIPYGSIDSKERQELLSGFQELGTTLLPLVNSPLDFSSAIYATVRKALRSIQVTCVANNRSFMIVEDGGYAFPLIHDDSSFGELLERCIGAVEHTARGMWNYQYMEQDDVPKTKRTLLRPALTLANSVLKEKLEPAFIAEAIIDEMRFLLRRKHDFVKYGTALVIGAGRVGRGLAIALKKQDINVRVCDKDQSRFKALDSIIEQLSSELNEETLSGVDLIIGATGQPSFTINDLKTFLDANQDCRNSECKLFLVSASSKQLELSSLYTEIGKLSAKSTLKAEKITKSTDSNYGTTFEIKLKNGISWEIVFLADGYPVIFFPSQTNGAPNRAMDPIMTELFLTACLLAANAKLLPSGLYTFDELRTKFKTLNQGPWDDLRDELKIFNIWCDLNDFDAAKLSNRLEL